MTANLPARSGIFVPIRNTMKKRNRYDTDCSAFAVVMNRLVVGLDFFQKTSCRICLPARIAKPKRWLTINTAARRAGV
jgi:hypothetical protein